MLGLYIYLGKASRIYVIIYLLAELLSFLPNEFIGGH